MAVSSDLVIFFGEESDNIQPSGSAPAPLHLGGYSLTLGVGTVDMSRKNKTNLGIRLPWSVAAVAEGVDAAQVGQGGETWLNLPDGKDFSQETSKGKGNRARVADIKSMFISAGISADAVQKEIKSGLTVAKIQALLAKIKGKAAAAYYEPPPEGENYPTIQWIGLDRAAALLSGSFKPKLKGKGNGGATGAGAGGGTSNAGDGGFDDTGFGDGADSAADGGATGMDSFT